VIPQNARARGFSLIEMLTVMAIISILTTLTGMGIGSILSGRAVDRASREISGLIEQAHAYAIAQQVPVFLGFATDSSPTEGGIAFCAFAQRDNAGTVEFVPISRAKFFRNVEFAGAFSFADAGSSLPTAPGIKSITEATGSFSPETILPSFRVDGRAFAASHVVRIGSAGDLRIESGKVVRTLYFPFKRQVDSLNPAPVKVFSVDGLMPTLEWRDGFTSS